jgi:hypothetical protein
MLSSLLVCFLFGALGSGGQSAPKMVVIDGSKTPDEIPQYLMWETAFRFFTRLPPVDDLPERSGHPVQAFLARPDWSAVLAEAKLQVAAQEACRTAFQARLDELRKLKRSDRDISEELATMTVACREESIKSGERLASRLSPAGRDYFLKWVRDSRKSISAEIAEPDLAFFRRPR